MIIILLIIIIIIRFRFVIKSNRLDRIHYCYSIKKNYRSRFEIFFFYFSEEEEEEDNHRTTLGKLWRRFLLCSVLFQSNRQRSHRPGIFAKIKIEISIEIFFHSRNEHHQRNAHHPR